MILIPTPQEFSYKELIKFLSRNEKECLHRIKDDTIYKVLEIENELVLFSVSFDNGLVVRIHTENQSPFVNDIIKNYIEDWFDLTADLKSFYEIARQDTILHQLCQKYHGLRMVGMPNLFESLIWSVIGQQINLNFAYSLKQRLVQSFGKSITFEGQTFYALPTPETLACLQIEDFRPYQFSKGKAQYIINISKAFAEGTISQQNLSLLSYDEIKQQLTAIKGVGNWTANYSMMKSLKSYDAFPVEDVGLHNAIKNQYGLEAKPTIADLHQMSTQWIGWRGYATFYFWHSLLG
ncbi:DNA-3-methyladenine glycosylase [Emticicia sp. BO119]|uniref:DNA-3-methyladenine glycosylase family protein n=1 Tax=Emticicia sp. BO119 TaxID=2757768 RepID=UPI0015F1035D|nr:DNA-3-methyladenine glycosylase [Emticicia sp. BO119]MBA4850599.1 DNA-3-methyladenine glycosylase 2 family protein [Emticicia sp. BO119]